MIYNVLIMVIGVLLFVAGVTDIKRKQISRGFLWTLLAICLGAALFQEDFRLPDLLGGMAVGLCAVGISLMSREQIGRGDGLVITAIGIVLGARRCLAVVSAAAVIMCAAAVVILLLKIGNKGTKLPFLPAIFAGYTLCILL